MIGTINYKTLDEICDTFNWKSLKEDLVEILLIIIENYDKGNSTIFKELYKPIEGDVFGQEEKNIINTKINELNKLGLVISTKERVYNRTVHISSKLKKNIYTNFPKEVALYNEYITTLDVKVEVKVKQINNFYIEGKFINKKDFKLKNNTEYNIKITEDKSIIYLEILESNDYLEGSMKRSGPADN
ncbi:hypothetical protein [Flavobacterium facile]|uniref:hypothetical protein n=1 Tax=Flavobacterium facile TaxID=2893174 RepID=UPI002E7A6CB6|nr:hypothetical protein [Flavobacterium sp. T-12]